MLEWVFDGIMSNILFVEISNVGLVLAEGGEMHANTRGREHQP